MNHHVKLCLVTVRKQVDEPTRVALAKQISELLDARDEFGKKKLTQAELGQRIGVSQEAVRRARQPDGVTPAIVSGMRALVGEPSPASAWTAEYKRMMADVSRRHGLRPEEENLEDEAAAILIRRGVGLREAERAVRAIREFKRDGTLTAEAWADLAHSLVLAYEKQKQVGIAPAVPHPKEPPPVGEPSRKRGSTVRSKNKFANMGNEIAKSGDNSRARGKLADK